MKIIEQFSEGKSPARNEDGVFFSADFAAVVDGSTSKLAPQFAAAFQEAGFTTGLLACQTVCEALGALPADASAADALSLLTDALRRRTLEVYDCAEADAHSPLEGGGAEAARRLTCSAVVFSRKRGEVWMFGDCQCRFGGQTFQNPKPADAVFSDIRSRAAHYLLDHGLTPADFAREDPARRLILPGLREQSFFQNDPNPHNPFRFLVLDGTPADASLVRTISTADARELILASDGFPQLFDTLEATEAHLQAALARDPLCIDELASTKGLTEGNRSFDDRTYLRLSL